MGRRKRARKTRAKPARPEAANAVTPRAWIDLAWAAGLVVLAWVHRIFFLTSNRDREWPFTFFYEGDAETFFRYARAILDGELYDNGVPFHPPGFAAFLAGVHTLLGAGAGHGFQDVPHLAVKVTLALVASLAVGLVYLLVRPYLGRVTALLAALLLTYHFGHYVISIATVSEGLYLTLLLAAFLLWSRQLDHPLSAPDIEPRRPRTAALLLGLLLGVLTLIRAEAMLMTGLLVAVGAAGELVRVRRQSAFRPALLVPWLLVAAGFCAAVAPWTWRNHQRLAELDERLGPQLAEPLPTFVPVTIYAPLNLALANNADADGTFSPDALMKGTGSDQLDFTNPRHLEYVLHGDAVAWRWVRAHPGDFATLVLRKWRLSLDVLKLGFSQWDWPGGLVGTRRPVDVFVPDGSFTRWILAVLAVLGLVVCLARAGGPRRFALVVLLPTALWLVTTGLFFGYVRQGLLVLPFWLVLVAAALVETPRALLRLGTPFPDRLDRRLLGTLAAVALVLLAVEGRGSGADRNYQATASTIDGHHLNRDDTIRLEVLPPEP